MDTETRRKALRVAIDAIQKAQATGRRVGLDWMPGLSECMDQMLCSWDERVEFGHVYYGTRTGKAVLDISGWDPETGPSWEVEVKDEEDFTTKRVRESLGLPPGTDMELLMKAWYAGFNEGNR